MQQHLHRVCAVQHGGFDVIVGNGGKTSHVNDHHVARRAPHLHDGHGPERGLRRTQPLQLEHVPPGHLTNGREDVGEDELPYKAQNDTAHHLGDVERSTHEVAQRDAVGQAQCKSQTQQVCEHHDHQTVFDGEHHGCPEPGIIREQLYVIGKPHERKLAGNAIPVG